MKLIEIFPAIPWGKKEHSCLVDNRGHERSAALSLQGYVRGVDGPAK